MKRHFVRREIGEKEKKPAIDKVNKICFPSETKFVKKTCTIEAETTVSGLT